MSARIRWTAAAVVLALLGARCAWAQDEDDPPGRVARLALIDGEAWFSPAGEDDWDQAQLNRPLVAGDRLRTERDSRAELDVGGAELRMAPDSTVRIANLDDGTLQVELEHGSANLHIRNFGQGDNYEIDTPMVAFVADGPGDYRLDAGEDGGGTRVILRAGSGTAYGADNASRRLAGTQAWEFDDPSLAQVVGTPLPPPDDFDSFVRSRDARFARAGISRDVEPEVIGAADLADNGDWDSEPEYGRVWYPHVIASDWAPYRFGHWCWVEPWGWTWVDDAPWGFAPFHYGRWVYVHQRWGWTPGPRHERPVYSPALVAFVGGAGVSFAVHAGGGAAVGWFPLGPRDVYVPWYHHSRNYFTHVNVSNVTVINRTVINNYYDGVRAHDTRVVGNYQYRGMVGAATVVRHEDFVGARRVAGVRVHVEVDELAHAPVRFTSPDTPTRASLANRTRVRRTPPPAERAVVVHRTPPPPAPSFEARRVLIDQNHGQPLARAQLRSLAPPARQDRGRVQVQAHAPVRAPAPAVVSHAQPAIHPQPLPRHAPWVAPTAVAPAANAHTPPAPTVHPMVHAPQQPGAVHGAAPPPTSGAGHYGDDRAHAPRYTPPQVRAPQPQVHATPSQPPKYPDRSAAPNDHERSPATLQHAPRAAQPASPQRAAPSPQPYRPSPQPNHPISPPQPQHVAPPPQPHVTPSPPQRYAPPPPPPRPATPSPPRPATPPPPRPATAPQPPPQRQRAAPAQQPPPAPAPDSRRKRKPGDPPQ